jgi:rhamnogalacturonyl hydrolase YesR
VFDQDRFYSKRCVSTSPILLVAYLIAAAMSGQAETTPLLRQRKPVADVPVREENNASGPDVALPVNEEGDVTHSWANPFAWPPAVYIALLLASAAIYWSGFLVEPAFDTATPALCRSTFDYTFRVNAARTQIERLSSHSWEYGTGLEAMLELLEPERTVFALQPFPADKIQKLPLKRPQGFLWMQRHIRTKGEPTLYADNYTNSDPASLGVAALMLGQSSTKTFQAATRQKDYLFNDAKRYSNGAISHRVEVAELWSDAVSMVPPFLAFYAVAANDLEIMKEAVRQCELHREVLRIDSGPKKGLWKHIVGPSDMADEGVWSTGAAWAAYGMVRVRATISGWQPSNETMSQEIQNLDQWIGEILDGAIRTDDDESGLLRNYLGDSEWFGETSGTALLAAAAYRMAVLNPTVFAQSKYVDWAHDKRKAVLGRVDDDGFAYPAVNPLKHASKEPVKESAEGESFLLTLGSAWRDCVCAGVCA